MSRVIYDQDSFFTLTIPGQIGLGMLSLSLALTCVIVARWLPGRWWVRALMAGALLVLFVWLSPQVYYQYYRLIFDGLPQQIVVRPLPNVLETLRILAFSDRPTLSFHGQGVLGWLMIGAALWGRRGAVSP